jgi:hypothetical protein
MIDSDSRCFSEQGRQESGGSYTGEGELGGYFAIPKGNSNALRRVWENNFS